MKHFLVLFLLIRVAFAQTTAYQWFDPASTTPSFIDGRGWTEGFEAPYDRLPAKAKQTVRPAVWRLSKQTSGQYINFRTNSNTILVRYIVKNAKSMVQMPATGVSGVDLYAKDTKGKWNWTRGVLKFGDTVEYRFENILHSLPFEHFRLYLPLYNEVAWMQIGVPEEKTFKFIPVNKEKPIVTYGTSIMHGAYASRPGLAWTNILGRKLNSGMVNLGFSGNGQLETALIDLINEVDAKLFILDCMPNLHDKTRFSAEEIESRMRKSVSELQKKHPGVPIVLVEHCSGIEGVNMDAPMVKKYIDVSRVAADVFQKMKNEGVKNIYHLSAEEIGFDLESTLDGTHPNDIGMMKYAEAYYKLIFPLLK